MRFIKFTCCLLISVGLCNHGYSFTPEHEAYLVNQTDEKLVVSYFECELVGKKGKGYHYENCQMRDATLNPKQFITFNMDIYDNHRDTRIFHEVQVVKVSSGSITTHYLYFDENNEGQKPNPYQPWCGNSRPGVIIALSSNHKDRFLCRIAGEHLL